MNVRRLGRLVLLLMVAFGLAAATPASAERIASKPDAPPAASREADLAKLTDLAARDGVRQALEAQGLTAAEVDARLGRLSDADLQRLAANVDQVQAAGQVPQYIWILLAVFLAVSIIVMIA
jgi:CTP:molybdopterin cytidylyltransferase MocA